MNRTKTQKRIAIIMVLIAIISSSGFYLYNALQAPHAAIPGQYYDHIVIIAMENQNYGDVIGNSAAPFINSIVPFGAVIPNYHSYGATSSITGCSASCYTT